MDYKTFKEHMNDKLESLDSFYNKVTEFQLDKNKSRAKKSRWNDAKVQRAIDNMYEDLFKNIYEKIKAQVENNGKKTDAQWIEYMEKNEVYENLDQSIYDIEIE
ncbi:hypothetical protein P3U10_04315 [Mammaliicoccus sciuri]|uniref:hypothetical protein n=1 Tax=Mammaliicoccus sciuri TaxID=1296 RepID=UPI002B2619F5|nr:hypothetical protein [Mammaliicoccus sciuri]WQK61407.1 hypothetical protein P3U10_04315 [Mammaliicoccus sciuri]